MARKVPFFADYKNIGKLSTVSDWMLWLSVAAAALSLAIEWNLVADPTGVWQQFLNAVSCFLALTYFTSDLLVNYLFQCAEGHRRNDFFDNGLNTILANQISQDYFTNDTISAGMYKMGVNGFENSFFTLNIAKRYLKGMVVKSAMVFVIFLIAALFGGNRVLIVVLQLALPLTIIQQTVRLLIFKNRVEQVYEYFKRIFQLPKGDQQDHLLIHNVTNYETALAWASIKLPDDIFDEMNPILTMQWENIKQRLNIQ